jgi:hypothetical protein
MVPVHLKLAAEHMMGKVLTQQLKDGLKENLCWEILD